jgi:hypothetical protein
MAPLEFAEHLLAIALEPIVAPLHVLFTRPKIVKLKTAKPAVIELAAQEPVKKIEYAAAHTVDFVDTFQNLDVLITALWALRIARQLQTRRKRNVVFGATVLAAVRFKVAKAL